MVHVALNISPDLGNPVGRIVAARKLGETCIKVAPMPEITIAEDYNPMLGEDYIGSARQKRVV